MKTLVLCLAILFAVGILIAACDVNTSPPSDYTDPSVDADPIIPEKEYNIIFDSWSFVTDWDGTESIAIKMSWTNTTDETVAFWTTCSVKAYQGGVQLENTFLPIEDTYGLNELENNVNLELRPGAFIEFVVVFKLRDTTSPVEVEVKDWISVNNFIHASTVFDLN